MIRSLVAAALLLVPVSAMAADAARDAIVAGYAAQAKQANPAFAGFSAQRGETLFRTKWAGGDERTPSCTACHTDNPRNPGQNAKTGRAIEPVAVSANPKRFTSQSDVEKQFGRDCKSVLGRECTALEKGDYITFMAGQ
jgi:mono/diheme cytochrome c family protein